MRDNRHSRWIGRVIAWTLIAAALSIASFAWSAGDERESQEGDVLRGGMLYATECSRCHNPRPPAERDNREWSVVMAHMRVRANIPGRDARDILAFLSAQNRAHFPPLPPAPPETVVVIQRVETSAPAAGKPAGAEEPKATGVADSAAARAEKPAPQPAAAPVTPKATTSTPPRRSSSADVRATDMQIARAKEIIKAKACQACHRIGKTGGTLGPDLNGVIARIGKDGVMKKLANPRYNNPASAMPPMGLSLEDRAAVAAYLATLKK